MDEDIRRHQRFSNYRKSPEKLEDAISPLRKKMPVNSKNIIEHYFPRLKEFKSTMVALRRGTHKDLFSGAL
jgi:hypothetical protein